jgi:peroxiredoxin
MIAAFSLGLFAISVTPGLLAGGPDLRPEIVSGELSAIRSALEEASSGSLSHEVSTQLSDRLMRILEMSLPSSDRLGALRLAARFGREGPPDATKFLRERTLQELARLSSDSPRARVILTEQCLPPLHRVRPNKQKELLAGFDAVIDGLLETVGGYLLQCDLLYLKSRVRLEVHRGWDAPWLDASERNRVDGWLAELEGSDVASPFGVSMRDEAASLRNELRGVSFGMSLVSVKGRDLKGRSISLGEFRGRIVVLSFWSSWCLPCLEMIPGEKELLRRLGDRGVVLIGVNSDASADQGAWTAAEKGMDWPQIWSPPGADDSLVSQLYIRHWPSAFVLDRQGAIRAKWVGSAYRDRWSMEDVEREILRILGER